MGRGSSIFRARMAALLFTAACAAGADQGPPAPDQSAKADSPAPKAGAAASSPPLGSAAVHAGQGSPPIAAPAAAVDEPSIAEAQAAAARLAAGTPADDDSRLSRARAAHWAPLLRAQAGGTTTDRTRAGEQSNAPLHWDELGGATTWLVSATWDLSQLVYDRDENQLALSRTHLARRRQEVSAEAAQLYAERLQALRRLREAHGAGRLGAALELLRATATLDALTGGLFAAALARAQTTVDLLGDEHAPQEER